MRGDFSRDSFDRLKHFRRVLMQQGRVQVDADWNEQVSILLHYIQTLAADIVGPYAGPVSDCGFGITVTAKPELLIGKGRYYVNGILCENEKDIAYTEQSYKPIIPSDKDYSCIVYLDVWERHITCLEDDDIREKALGGIDTGTRAKTVWQVKIKELTVPSAYDCLDGAGLLDKETVLSKACLRAEARQDQEQLEPCLAEPEARYRGPENQLYRVEMHNGGSLSEENPTFKWSRENGSVVFPIKGIKSNDTDAVTLELESLGCNDRSGLTVNDWVEIEDDVSVLNNEVKPLLQVQKLDSFEMTVTLKKKAGVNYNLKIEDLNPDAHALLRRWDQKKEVTNEGVLKIVESSVPDEDWLDIENGIKIQFQPGGTYRTGDYWLISARTALGDVEWPEEVDDQGNSTPKYLSPHGVMHHLAPLAIISVGVEGKDLELKHDCRCKFSPLSDYCAYNYYGQLGIGVDLLCPE